MNEIPVPDAIRRIADSEDRQLAWHFFIFFSRFEYALKRHETYLKKGTDKAEANWDLFASSHNARFIPDSTPQLQQAVRYFREHPPRKQICASGILSWTKPQAYDDHGPLLVWLLLVIRYVRNNLFHGGKFPLIPIEDPSRDRDLLVHALAILSAALELDHQVKALFFDGID